MVVEFRGIQCEIGWAPYKTARSPEPHLVLPWTLKSDLHIMCPAGHHTDGPEALPSILLGASGSSGFPCLSPLMLAVVSPVLLGQRGALSEHQRI